MATADLTWLIIRNNSSSLLKRNKLSLSLEANNIKGKNSFRYNGFIHRKTVGIEPANAGIEPAKEGKGVVLITRKSKGLRRPAKNLTRQELKRDSRRTIATIRATLRANNYRKDLVNPAVRRACAILKSQKPVVIKKKARGTKKQ
ncbi:60S ribosomal protein L28 [Elysia marginata]|uniref:Large ribosomal subunit protein eL28 n=1 Tax=Elysia marginata TaxID=1093978 RepID=A0AAV4GKK6_9GAST|nr:60S ribosomal protein L28 [Elysia marginata]